MGPASAKRTLDFNANTSPKTTIKTFLALFILWGVFSPTKGTAADTTIFFWYPGAEGSEAQARPLLEDWALFMNQQVPLPSMLKIAYSRAPIAQGLKDLGKTKPALGLLSLEAALLLHDQHPYQAVAQTKAEPEGNGSQRYFLFKHKDTTRVEEIFLSEPLSNRFVEKIVLRENVLSGNHPPFRYQEQILTALKQIGEGTKAAAVLLNSYQTESLKRLSLPWAKNLEQWAVSPPLPTPPLVIFKEWGQTVSAEKLQQALLLMSEQAAGKEILQEMRLNGFMKPNEPAYQEIADWYRAP